MKRFVIQHKCTLPAVHIDSHESEKGPRQASAVHLATEGTTHPDANPAGLRLKYDSRSAIGQQSYVSRELKRIAKSLFRGNNNGFAL